MKHDFEERKQSRIENAERLAEKNKKESESLYLSAHEMASAIPFGQPILIGHHSEKRDRRYRERIGNKFDQSHRKQEKADYYEQKAKTIANDTNIYSDDPEALQKLTEKLNSRKSNQEFMKAANRCIKKQDKEAFLKLPNSTESLWGELNKPDKVFGRGFASFSLTNNNANIRRIEQRIAHLKKLEVKTAADITLNGVRIFENLEANRLQFIFDGKPEEATRTLLKKWGFRWSPREGAWQRHISNSATFAAKQIIEQLKK